MAVKVCVLTEVQAREKEERRATPCEFHQHMRLDEAHSQVGALRVAGVMIEGYGGSRWVGEGFRAITKVRSSIPLPSRGLHYVDGVPVGHIMKHHYPIPACGAKDMTARMHVYDVNQGDVNRGASA